MLLFPWGKHTCKRTHTLPTPELSLMRNIFLKSFVLFSVAKLCPTLCDSMNRSTLGFSVLRCLQEFAQPRVRWVGDTIQPPHPLSPPSPAFSLSQPQGLFQWVSYLHQWPKYWSFSFSISPSNEYSELISFRIDWFDLLAVQWTLKHLLQHHSSKALILWCSAFFMGQTSHVYTTTGKNHSFEYAELCRQSDVFGF